MALNDVYFFDSYAIIEMILGSKNYVKYKNSEIVTTKNNLFEVVYWLLRCYSEKEAVEFIKKYYPYVVDFDESVIVNAAALRLKYKKKRLSMVDCIGYTVAESWSVPFLTGDKEFEQFENVEFVK